MADSAFSTTPSDQADPFAADCPTDGLYLNQNHQQRLNLLLHLVQATDLLLIVEGPNGAGKTTLLNKLTTEVGDSWDFVRVQAGPDVTPIKLLSLLTQGFGATPISAGVHNMQAAIRQRLQTLNDHDKLPVLAIDDVETLPEDTLETLLKLHEPVRVDGLHSRLIRLIFFATPALHQRNAFSSHEHLEPDSIHRMEPIRLQQNEVAEYLKLRLLAAGINELPFTEAEIQELFWRSEGLPGQINELARASINGDRAPSSQHRTWVGLPLMLGIGAVAAILASLWILQGDLDSDVVSSVGLNPPPPVMVIATDPAAVTAVAPMPSEPPRAAIKPEPETEPEAQPMPEVRPSPVTLLGTDTAQKVMKYAAPANSNEFIKSPNWIMQRPAQHLTLQLLAMSQPASLFSYVQSHRLGPPLASFEKRTGTKPLHVLIWGDFASREAATRALATLPAKIRASKPWIRSFESIQTTLKP
ncbi:MAG TPA: AAA family ATPase [Chromatiales bacterium]|nr:AAA family ATPase [Chromatiales bacterium]